MYPHFQDASILMKNITMIILKLNFMLCANIPSNLVNIFSKLHRLPENKK